MLLPLVEWYVRRELPGWGRALRAFKLDRVNWTALRSDGPIVEVAGKRHGYLMRLDLRKPWDRSAYLLQRFPDLDAELFMEAAVRKGDAVFDVGANRGMLTLSVARLTGPSGRVLAIEPNPSESEWIGLQLKINAIEHVSLKRIALAEAAGETKLNILQGLSGLGTLATPEDQNLITASYDVPVGRGDALADIEPSTPVVIKIDVEGFECHVLRGFSNLLESHLPAIFLEVEPRWLNRAGSSVEELFSILDNFGYMPYLAAVRRRWHRQRLVLIKSQGIRTWEQLRGRLSIRNIAWIHPRTLFLGRLSPYFVSN